VGYDGRIWGIDELRREWAREMWSNDKMRIEKRTLDWNRHGRLPRVDERRTRLVLMETDLFS